MGCIDQTLALRVVHDTVAESRSSEHCGSSSVLMGRTTDVLPVILMELVRKSDAPCGQVRNTSPRHSGLHTVVAIPCHRRPELTAPARRSLLPLLCGRGPQRVPGSCLPPLAPPPGPRAPRHHLPALERAGAPPRADPGVRAAPVERSRHRPRAGSPGRPDRNGVAHAPPGRRTLGPDPGPGGASLRQPGTGPILAGSAALPAARGGRRHAHPPRRAARAPRPRASPLSQHSARTPHSCSPTPRCRWGSPRTPSPYTSAPSRKHPASAPSTSPARARWCRRSSASARRGSKRRKRPACRRNLADR